MGLKEMYSAAGAKILGASTAAKVIGTVAVTSAVIAGGAAGVHAYTNGQDFTPTGANRAMRANQVHFDGDESTVTRQDESEKDKKSESEMYERDENAEDQEKPQTGESSSYLFDSVQQQETAAGGSLLDSSGAAAAIAGTAPAAGAGTAQPGTVLDIVSDPSKADVVLKPGAAGTSAETPAAGDNGGSTGSTGTTLVTPPYPVPDPDPTPTPTPTPDTKPSQPSKGDTSGGGSTTEPATPDTPVTPVTPPTISDIENSAKEDTSGTSEAPGTGGFSGTTEKRYDEATVSADDSRRVAITMRYNNDFPLYNGQSVTAADIVRAMSAVAYTGDVAQKNVVAHYWTSEDLGKYLNVKGIRFDGGEWITEFPVTIPNDAARIDVDMEYRYKESDDWTQYTDEAIYTTLKPNRVLVLTDKLTEVGQTIPSDWIIKENQSGNSTINLYGYQYGLYAKLYGWDTGTEFKNLPALDKLYTGWTENGEPVPWIYKAESGRHILQPGEFVDVPEGYTVKLTNKNTDSYYEWQTLTNFDESVLKTDENGKTTLEVPEYVQAVSLEGESIIPYASYSARGDNHSAVCSDNVTDYMVIPATVNYIRSDGCGNVLKGYIVDENNENYASVDDILTNKDEDEYLSIPVTKETVTVPENVVSVNLPEYYDGTVVIEGTRLLKESGFLDNQEPLDINFANMYEGKIEVENVDMMDEVVRKYGRALDGTDSTISTGENSPAYDIHKDCLTHEEKNEDGKEITVLDRVVTNSAQYTLPDNVQEIAPGAFSGSPNLESILITEANKDVVINAATMRDSDTGIACVDPEKAAEIAALVPNKVTTAVKTADGYTYLEFGDTIMLLGAPKDVTEFRGTIKDGDKELAVNVIGDNAFDGCDKLEYVSLPESVTEIGRSAFEDCTSLSGVMIEGTGDFTIKNSAFDGCTALRFIGSNAMKMTLENGYNIAAGSKSDQLNIGTEYQSEFELWRPTGGEGYDDNWQYFDTETNVTSYAIHETNGMQVLYAQTDNESWLALRAAAASSASTEQPSTVELPSDTLQIFKSCFEDIDVPFTVDWQKISQLQVISENAFTDSGLSGMVNPVNEKYCLIMGNSAFANTSISEVDFSGIMLQSSGYSLFTDNKKLTKMTYGATLRYQHKETGIITSAPVITALSLYGCDNLTDIIFTNEIAPGLATYSPGDQFVFRDAESDDAIKLTVPDEYKETYYKEWLPRFIGYDVSNPDEYKTFKSIVENDEFTYYMYFLDENWDLDEEKWNSFIQAVCEYKIREGENALRARLGMELLEALDNPEQHLEDYGGSDPFAGWSMPDDSKQPVTDTPENDDTTSDLPKLDITITDPSENEIPSVDAPEEPSDTSDDTVSAPSGSSDVSDAPDEGESAASDNENTGSAPEDNGAAEGEAT